MHTRPRVLVLGDPQGWALLGSRFDATPVRDVPTADAALIVSASGQLDKATVGAVQALRARRVPILVVAGRRTADLRQCSLTPAHGGAMTLTLPAGSAPRALFAALGAKLPPPPPPAPPPASPPVKPAAAVEAPFPSPAAAVGTVAAEAAVETAAIVAETEVAPGGTGEGKPATARKAKPAAAEPSPEQAELAERLLQRYARKATPGAVATLAPHLTLGAWSREEELRREVLAAMVAQGVGLTDVGIATRLREAHGRRERNAARRAEGSRVGKDPVMGRLARMAAEEAVTRTGQGLRWREMAVELGLTRAGQGVIARWLREGWLAEEGSPARLIPGRRTNVHGSERPTST